METHINYERWRRALFPWSNEGFGGFDRAERFIELVLDSSESASKSTEDD